jgi:arylformamidase
VESASESIVFRGMTAAQLASAYDVFSTIPNLEDYVEETGRIHLAAAENCPPVARDIAYGESEIEKLDVYAPRDAENAPVLIDIHGGGFTMGTKNTRAIPAPAVSSRGVVWVPIDYGLAPDHRMDQIVDHVRKAVAWVHANIEAHGGNPDRLFVSGNSAGAYLTAATLMPGWHADYGLAESAIKGACLMSGLFDLDPLVLAAAGPNQALRMTLADSARLSPIRHLPKNGCPIVVAYGAPELEAFIGQSVDFASAWQAAGFDASTIVVPDAHHMAMSRELANADGKLFAAVMQMIGV